MTLADLAEEISPFPDAGNLLYGDRTSSPLRKLRPIRSNGDSSPPTTVQLTRGTDSISMDTNPNNKWDIVVKKVEQMGGCDNHNFFDYYSNSISKETLVLPPFTQIEALPSNKGEIQANSNPDPTDVANNSTGCTWFDQEEKKEPEQQGSKRKREVLLFDMVKKMIKKQEEMHMQLIEIIDKHDKDRMMREDDWRRQELERQEKEREMREQQTTRNLALISFIENLFQFSEAPSRAEDESEEHKVDTSANRWPQSEVKALITIRTAMDHKFRSIEQKHNSWEELSHGMTSMGYSRNAKKCREKWENINKYFKKTIEKGKRPKSAKTCPYFDELNGLYRNGVLNPGSTPIEIKNEGERLEQTDLKLCHLSSVS